MLQSKIHSHKDLIVWQKSMNLVDLIYTITKKFPKEEIFILTSQMRRSAISIPSNIAEGRRRHSRKNYLQFLVIAYGSSAELETQLEISLRQKYITLNDYSNVISLLEEIMKILNVMTNKLKD